MQSLRRSLIALLLLFPVTAAAQSTQIHGDWDLTLTTPNGPVNVRATFKQEGDKLSGLLKSSRGEVPAQVSLRDKEITINYTVNYNGNDLPITLKGRVADDAMNGTADFGGLADGEWSGKRAAAATGASAAAATSGANITGTWTFEVETSAGSGTPTFTFKQEGETLTGQYSGQLGEAPLKGTVKGSEIHFTIESGQGSVVYQGTIEKDGTMKGRVQLADVASGTWTGKRK